MGSTLGSGRRSPTSLTGSSPRCASFPSACGGWEPKAVCAAGNDAAERRRELAQREHPSPPRASRAPLTRAPQPFQGINPTTYQDAGAEWLDLFDGGENAENVPLDALFLKARALDVVVALDTTAET